MFAHDYGKNFRHIGSEGYVKAHLLSDPIVPVIVTEDPSGMYWGWMDAGSDKPCMIWPTETAFRICFPCKPEDKEERGDGRIVRLRVERTTQ